MRKTNVERRPDYVAIAGQETFIVPLLKAEIEGFLKRYLEGGVKGRKILDVGCGRQPFREMIEEDGAEYVGLDVEQNAEGTVQIICRIDEELPEALVRHGEFDLVLCTEVLEHVAFWKDTFANFDRLLAPGGLCLLTCPFFYPLHEEPWDYWRPTDHVLKLFAERYGFEVIEERRLGSFWDVFGTLLGDFKCRPKNRGIGDRLLSRAAGIALRWLFRVAKRGVFERRLEVRSKIYLANLAVLRKKGGLST